MARNATKRTRKLVYWFARRLDDHESYSARARTRRELREIVDEMPESFGPPQKVTVTYKDAFDLMRKCLQEGGIEP